MDKNLKLAIIGSLINEGLFSFTVEDFFMDVLKKPYDLMADYNYDPLPEMEEYFESLDLNTLGVEQLKVIDYYAGCDIVHCVWNQWDGEDFYFDIFSLDGIEICSGLEVFDTDLTQIDDLSPLGKLKNLKKISIINCGQKETETCLSSLAHLSNLEELNLKYFRIDTSSSSYKTFQKTLKEKFNYTVR